MRERPYVFAAGLAVVLAMANVAARSSFAQPSSWPATLAAFAPFALAAMASTPAILGGGGGLDISIGPLLNIVCIVIIGVLLPAGIADAWIAIPIALGIGAGVGAINGVLVTVLRYQAVLATLCTLFVLTGLALKLQPEPESANLGWLSSLGDQVGPIPGALLVLAVPAALWFALRRTPYVKALYSVGGDDVAAFSAGVPVTSVRLFAYVLGGVFAAFAGIAFAAVTQSADATQGLQYTLPAIAAVAIGGTSLLGGRGSLAGSVAGAAVMFLTQTLLDSLEVSNLWLQVVYGALLIFAIVLGSIVATPRTQGKPVTA
jgi:ribose transport system permease protein